MDRYVPPFIQSKILTNEVQTNEDVSLVKIASLAKRLLEARDL